MSKTYYTICVTNKFSGFDENPYNDSLVLKPMVSEISLRSSNNFSTKPKDVFKCLDLQQVTDKIENELTECAESIESKPTQHYVTVLNEGQLRDTRKNMHKRPTNNRNDRAKRLYDRHSGTGRGKEMKKGGDGSHNWGNLVTRTRINDDGYDITNGLENVKLINNDREGVMIDYSSYKEQQLSKRSNLPVAINVNTTNKVSTDVELQKSGYVRYIKPVTSDTSSRTGTTNNYHKPQLPNIIATNAQSFLERKMISKRERRNATDSKITQQKPKAPLDIENYELFPSLG